MKDFGRIIRTGMVLCIVLIVTFCSTAYADLSETNTRRVEVKNVEEFLDAIAPDTEIVMKRGDYELSSSERYGMDISDYCYWRETYDGYELVIHAVNNLHISGDEELIDTVPRYANVLNFENCSNIYLDEITIGHTKQPGSCSGGVIYAENSDSLTFNDCELYGCGILGIQAMSCSDILLEECEIYSCSLGAGNFTSCRNIRFDDCEIYDCSDKLYGYAMALLLFDASDGVYITDCEINDNCVQNIFSTGYSRNCYFVGNEVKNNICTESLFSFAKYAPVVDGCKFRNNTSELIYAPGSVYAVDMNGNTQEPDVYDLMEENDLLAAKIDYTQSVDFPVTVEKKDGVAVVSTIDEFLAAIAPDTTIVLSASEYLLENASDYGTLGGDFYSWEESFDGPELVIHDADNLSIISEDNDPLNHSILTVPRYANVISFRNCDNLMLSGLTMGHTQEPGYCCGGVLNLSECKNVITEFCRMYGCGTIGVYSYGSVDITVSECEIYTCSQAGVSMFETDGIRLENCDIHDIEGPALSFAYCGDKYWNGSLFANGDYSVTDKNELKELSAW